MALLSLLVVFLFLLLNGESLSEPTPSKNTNSAVAFVLCKNFAETVNFRIHVRPKNGTDVFTTTFTESENKTKFLNGTIEQGEVKSAKITTESMSSICFQSLVVDTSIIIDQPTNVKASCANDNSDDAEDTHDTHDTRQIGDTEDNGGTENTRRIHDAEDTGNSESSEATENPDVDVLCKEFATELKPVFVCPEALTKLLQNKTGVITGTPRGGQGPRDFEPQKYNIVNDMGQASFAIASGLNEQFGLVVSRTKRRFRAALDKDNRLVKLQGFVSLKSFMSAMGPVFSIFSGIMTIITTFLTPNPFEQLAEYLGQEFDEVHRRLTDIQSDIADLKRIVQSDSATIQMTRKFETIRYSLRRYETMVKSLSKDPVCGSDNLFARSEVVDFMTQYEEDRVEDSLLDLLGVEYGEVIEASSVLIPFVRAYCNSDPYRVKRFMDEIYNYAEAGSLAHTAYKDLQCRKYMRTDCSEEEREEWVRKLYRFWTKTQNLILVTEDPIEALRLELGNNLAAHYKQKKLANQDNQVSSTKRESLAANHKQVKQVNQITQENQVSFTKRENLAAYQNQVKQVNQVNQESQVSKRSQPIEAYHTFNDSYAIITNKLHSINDWPETCILNSKMYKNNLLLTLVAQTNATIYGTAYLPWALYTNETPHNVVQNARFETAINPPRGYTKQILPFAWMYRSKKTPPLCYGIVSNKNCVADSKKAPPGIERFGYPPKEISTDHLMYFMLNPRNYKEGEDVPQDPMRPLVSVGVAPVDAYFASPEKMKFLIGDEEVVVGCWNKTSYTGCPKPSKTAPNKAPNTTVTRYFAIIRDSSVTGQYPW